MKKLLFLFGILLMIASCSPSSKKNEEVPTVTVTIEPLRFFANAIAGDKFNIVSMVPSGSSPETYDPTPQQLVTLNKSTAYFKIGYIGFEQTWMEKLKANNPSLKIYDTSIGVNLIHEEEEIHGDHHHEGGVDPHIWNSTVNANIISDNIYKALCELSPKNKEYFSHNLDSLKEIINQTNQEIKKLLVNADSTFLIYHPALSYYAQEYGLNQVCIEEGGKQPSPASLKKLIESCRKEKPEVIFIQKEFDVRNAELIANELKLKIVTINPLSYDWRKEMIEPAKALSKK